VRYRYEYPTTDDRGPPAVPHQPHRLRLMTGRFTVFRPTGGSATRCPPRKRASSQPALTGTAIANPVPDGRKHSTRIRRSK